MLHRRIAIAAIIISLLVIIVIPSIPTGLAAAIHGVNLLIVLTAPRSPTDPPLDPDDLPTFDD